MSLGLTMDEIQEIITQASETTPDIGPDGNEMGDPEYITAYLLNIIIPLLRANNLRIEEQLAAIGIMVPTKEQILDALAVRQSQQEQMSQGNGNASAGEVSAPDTPAE